MRSKTLDITLTILFLALSAMVWNWQAVKAGAGNFINSAKASGQTGRGKLNSAVPTNRLTTALTNPLAPAAGGTGVVTVTNTNPGEGCLAFTPAQGGGPDNWEVIQGGTYTMTITGVTECNGSGAITVFLQGSSTGNFCVTATGGAGTYTGSFTMPNPACFTYPISYKCGAGQPCNNANTFNAKGPSGANSIHLRAATFNGTCNKTGNDVDCFQQGCTPNVRPTIDNCPGDSEDLGCNPPSIPGSDPAVTAHDNCGPVTVQSQVTNTTNGCMHTRTITYTATNTVGTTTCTKTYTWKEDLTGPVLMNVPAGGDLGCNPTPPSCSQAVTASDTCSGTVNVTCTPGAITGPDCAKRQTFTYSAVDACNNSTTQTVTYTWKVDTTAPVLANVPAGGDLGCNPETLPTCATNVTASDNCDGPVNVTCTPGAITGPDCAKRQTFTYSAVDGCNNRVSQDVTYTWKVDLTAPVLANVPAGGDLGCNPETLPTCATNVTAMDNCDGSVNVTCTPGAITGPDCAKRQTFTYSAVDGCNNRVSQDVTYTWKVDRTPPVISGVGDDRTIECPATPVFSTPSASDNCGTVSSFTSADVTTPGACANTYSITRTWTATDGCGNTSTARQTINVVDTTPPTISCPGNLVLGSCNSNLVTKPTASDACGSATVTCNWDFATRFPVGTTNVSCTATDACGLTASCSFSVRVKPDPTPLTINGATMVCGGSDNVMYTYTGTNDPAYQYLWTVTGGATIDAASLPATGRSIKVDVNGAPGSTYTVSLKITDTETAGYPAGNAACMFTINKTVSIADCHCALTQGFYGNANGTFNTIRSATLVSNLLASGPLVVGKLGVRSVAVAQADASCITLRLPAGGTPTALPTPNPAPTPVVVDKTITTATSCNTTNPALPLTGQGKFSNVLLGQTIALSLNVRLDPTLGASTLCATFVSQKVLPGGDGRLGTPDDILDPGPNGILGDADDPVATFNIPASVLSALCAPGLGQTVDGLLKLANLGLAGQATGGASLADINAAVDAINRGYDNCRARISCTAGAACPPPAPAPLRAVPNDFDGDAKSDLAVWRGSNWLVVPSGTGAVQTTAWGAQAAPYNDALAAGDYDGDGKTDYAVFRRSNGHWYIKQSRDGAALDVAWGLGTDIPVPADYDGDGKTDLAVWRGADTNWYIKLSSGGTQTIRWGASYAPYYDVPVPGDYDGDGKADAAIWRGSNSLWYIRKSSDGQAITKLWGANYAPYFDVPVPGDYDGDGKTDIAVWRGSDTNWYITRSADNAVQVVSWGTSTLGDVPVPGDYDGDGKNDLAVWRESAGMWYVRSGAGTTRVQALGQVGDVPVTNRPS